MPARPPARMRPRSPGCVMPTRPCRRARRSGWPSARPTCSGSATGRSGPPPAGPGRLRVRPRAERRSRHQDGPRRRHDHLRGPLRRDAPAPADADGGTPAQDDHPRRRGHRAGHRVHLAAQRHAARVRHRDGDPDRRRPRCRRHRRQRARRPVPRLPELLRDARLQSVAHHRARAGPALRAPAPLPVRQRRSLHGGGQPDRRGGQLPRPQGGFPRRDRVRARRAVPHRRRVQRRGPVAQRLHRPADLLPVGPAGQGGLPHHPRLPVALGHRLVLVLAALRRAETAGQEAVAAPLPALGRVPEAGRPGPPLRPERRADAEAAPPLSRGGHPGRGDPGRTRRRVPAVFSRQMWG